MDHVDKNAICLALEKGEVTQTLDERERKEVLDHLDEHSLDVIETNLAIMRKIGC